MKKMNQIAGIFLASILVIFSIKDIVHAESSQTAYLDENGVTRYVSSVQTSIPGNKKLVNGEWYLFSGTESTSTLNISGDAHIILANDCEWTVNGGIRVTDGNKLTIYAQTEDEAHMGKLIANATAGAGIGSPVDVKSGEIVINGGNITAKGAATDRVGGAGIGGGGGPYGATGKIVINNGIIKATGSSTGNENDSFGAGAGIGAGGNSSSADEIVITGGVIEAVAGWNGAAGIGGGGHDGILKKVSITGGIIKATGTWKHSEEGNGNANAIGGGAGKEPSDDSTFSNCMILDGVSKRWKVYGDKDNGGIYRLDRDFEVASGEVFEIRKGSVLEIPSGVILTNNGRIVHNGKLINHGTLTADVSPIHEVYKDTGDGKHVLCCDICADWQEVKEPHNYIKTSLSNGWKLVCPLCGYEKTITLEDIDHTVNLKPEDRDVLEAPIKESDSLEVGGVTYQWYKKDVFTVTSFVPSLSGQGGRYTATFTFSEPGVIVAEALAEGIFVSLSGDNGFSYNKPINTSDGKIYIRNIPAGSYSLEVHSFGIENSSIPVKFYEEEVECSDWKKIEGATAATYKIPEFHLEDQYMVEVKMEGGNVQRKGYTCSDTDVKADGTVVKTERKADGTIVITKLDANQEVLEKVTSYSNGTYIKDGYSPKVIEGDKATYVSGKDLSFRSDDDIVNFKKVLVDGKEIKAEHYTLTEGSIIITLKDSFLKTLAKGKHTVEIISVNGTAKADFTVSSSEPTESGNRDDKGEDVPKTGDIEDVKVPAWIMLLGTVFIVLGVTRFRKKSN